MISIKTPSEIELMRKSGQILARIKKELVKKIKPGISTLRLDRLAEKLMKEYGVKPSFKEFKGYPSAICVSINEEVVHGLPGPRIIQEGDVVGLDLGVCYQGFHTDSALTIGVGKISSPAERLIKITRDSLQLALKKIKAGQKLSTVQKTIQKTIETAGYGLVKDLSGHGIGRQLQEEPAIPNYLRKNCPEIMLKKGMTLCLEPMVTAGQHYVHVQPDGWTVVTSDKSLSAHFEETILVTEKGAEVLTS